VVSDSLLKWVKDVNWTDTQAIPGLTLSKAADRIRDHTITVTPYMLVIVNIGTNDIQKHSPTKVANMAANLITLIRDKNPKAKIAFNAIPARPCDIPEELEKIKANRNARKSPTYPRASASYEPLNSCTTVSNTPIKTQSDEPNRREIFNARPWMEKKRRHVNRDIRKVCNKLGVAFLETWKCLQNKDKTVKLGLYALDGLHFNQEGIHTMANYIGGNASCLLDSKKRIKPKRKRLTREMVIPPAAAAENKPANFP
jgi:lysophospholipase L1-like esterase